MQVHHCGKLSILWVGNKRMGQHYNVEDSNIECDVIKMLVSSRVQYSV